MFPTIRLPNTTMWEPGPYPGVEFAHLSHDSTNGSRFLLRKFAPGTVIPAHRHPQAAESVVILKGKWIEGNVEYGPGSFFYAPKNTVHGPHRGAGRGRCFLGRRKRSRDHIPRFPRSISP